VFLGHNWLKHHNPSVDWKDSQVVFDRCPPVCRPGLINACLDPDHSEDDANMGTPLLEDGDRLLMIDFSPAIDIRASSTPSVKLAEEAAKHQVKKSFEELVPLYLHNFCDVFDKKDFDELPPSCPWDHAIELLPGTVKSRQRMVQF
jgi:hypothetical protein